MGCISPQSKHFWRKESHKYTNCFILCLDSIPKCYREFNIRNAGFGRPHLHFYYCWHDYWSVQGTWLIDCHAILLRSFCSLDHSQRLNCIVWNLIWKSFVQYEERSVSGCFTLVGSRITLRLPLSWIKCLKGKMPRCWKSQKIFLASYTSAHPPHLRGFKTTVVLNPTVTTALGSNDPFTEVTYQLSCISDICFRNLQ